MIKFKEFYLDTNQYTGLVESGNDWKKLVKIFKANCKLSLKELTKKLFLTENIEVSKDKIVPLFEFTTTDEKISLVDWAKDNNMDKIILR